MPKKKKAAKPSFPSKQPGYVSPRLGEPESTLIAHAPKSFVQQIHERARELGYRSTQRYLLTLVKADLTAAQNSPASKRRNPERLITVPSPEPLIPH